MAARKKKRKYLVVLGDEITVSVLDGMKKVSELFGANDLNTLASLPGFPEHKDANLAVGDATSLNGVVLEVRDGKIVPVKLDMETIVKFTRDHDSK